MFQTTLGPVELLSHQFLQQLLVQPQQQFQLLNSDILLSDIALANSVAIGVNSEVVTESQLELRVYAQGLNLQILVQVQQALSVQLKSLSCHPIAVPGSRDDYAVGIHVEALETENLAALIEDVALRFQVELVLLGARPSLAKPGLLLMDMDSTVIDVECIDEIAKLAGVGPEVSEVTELAMQGKLDFVESLNNRVACLAGCEQQVLQQVLDALPLNPGLVQLIKVLKQYSWKVAIASGGFTFFADYLLARLDLDAALANNLEIIDGKLTGRVMGEIVDAKVKARTLVELAELWDIDPLQTVAMGDGANDLVMMKAAALGVAYHAKPLVRQQAKAAIRHGGLDSLLWMLATD